MQGLMATPGTQAWIMKRIGFVPAESPTKDGLTRIMQANAQLKAENRRLEWLIHGRQRGQYEALNMQARTPRKNCNVRRKAGRVA